jgi:hypothetical protein
MHRLGMRLRSIDSVRKGRLLFLLLWLGSRVVKLRS